MDRAVGSTHKSISSSPSVICKEVFDDGYQPSSDGKCNRHSSISGTPRSVFLPTAITASITASNQNQHTDYRGTYCRCSSVSIERMVSWLRSNVERLLTPSRKGGGHMPLSGPRIVISNAVYLFWLRWCQAVVKHLRRPTNYVSAQNSVWFCVLLSLKCVFILSQEWPNDETWYLQLPSFADPLGKIAHIYFNFFFLKINTVLRRSCENMSLHGVWVASRSTFNGAFYKPYESGRNSASIWNISM